MTQDRLVKLSAVEEIVRATCRGCDGSGTANEAGQKFRCAYCGPTLDRLRSLPVVEPKGGAIERTWRPIDSAPQRTLVEVLMRDGTTDVAEWRDNRQCMLGPAAGERGPGWVSEPAGWLPIDEPTHWRALRLAAAQHKDVPVTVPATLEDAIDAAAHLGRLGGDRETPVRLAAELATLRDKAWRYDGLCK